MLEEIRNWLNGSRDFDSGVTLYLQVGDNEKLKSIFLEGETFWCKQKLQEELLRILTHLKANDSNIAVTPATVTVTNKVTNTNYSQSELYLSCKKEADLLYKEVMNKRAILFKMAEPVTDSDINSADLVKERSKLAIDVVVNFQKVSLLYDRADYVLKTGRLPDDTNVPIGDEYQDLPDHLVKQTLDNLRKNLSKLKRKELSEERKASIEKHIANIEKLEKRWHLLKPM